MGLARTPRFFADPDRLRALAGRELCDRLGFERDKRVAFPDAGPVILRELLPLGLRACAASARIASSRSAKARCAYGARGVRPTAARRVTVVREVPAAAAASSTECPTASRAKNRSLAVKLNSRQPSRSLGATWCLSPAK